MARNPLKVGNPFGIGGVTRQMVLGRAAELAIINGSWLHNVRPSDDFEKGRRELTGETDIAPKEATLESSPKSERWDPVPGSKGHKTTVPYNDDGDEDRRSDNERLVEKGVAGVEDNQMVKAARAAASGRKQ